MKFSNTFLDLLETLAKNIGRLSASGHFKTLDLLRNLIRLLAYAGGKKP